MQFFFLFCEKHSTGIKRKIIAEQASMAFTHFTSDINAIDLIVSIIYHFIKAKCKIFGIL